MTDHPNVVRENFFRDFGDVTLVQNLFKPIRAINRIQTDLDTYMWKYWTYCKKSLKIPPNKQKSPHTLKIHRLLSRGQKSTPVIFSKSFFWLKRENFVQILNVFKKTFLKKLLEYFSDVYIAIYGFSDHVSSMFYLSYISNNRVSHDISKIF